MQPAYFPWTGYFNLIGQVDAFVFLDDAQYEKGTWQNRNRVLVGGQPYWLTVPAHREFLGQAINQVAIVDRLNWRAKHFNLLSQTYARHPCARDMLEAAACILDRRLARIADLNIKIITEFSAKLGLNATLFRSSELGVVGGRTERLINICSHLNCDEYVSPVGSAEYLAEDHFSEMTSIRLLFNNFIPAPYPQMNVDTFVSHMSVLDVVANLGWRDTADYIRATR